MGTDFRPPVVFFVPGSGEGAERIGGRAVRVRRRVTERGRERQSAAGILPGPEGPEGLEGPGVVLSCNLPGQAMQRIPPVYYLCR